MIFTASIDKFVHIFNIDGEPRGTLKQGYMMMDDYLWDAKINKGDEINHRKLLPVNSESQTSANDYKKRQDKI